MISGKNNMIKGKIIREEEEEEEEEEERWERGELVKVN